VAGSDGDNLGARTQRNALWAQDEWDFSTRWSAYAGLRWEGIDTTADSVGGGAPVHNQSRVWTPLLHSVWKLDEASKDQLRLALTRSYRSPTLSNLVARPRVALNNAATQPDRIGNPALRPELATGLDLAFDHYFSAGGLMSLSVFDRRIKGLIRSRTQQDASTGRWISQPQNVGDARTRGVEAEAKFRLAEIVDEREGPAPNVDLRSNVAVYRSQVSGVDASDNRLDQQPRASLNLGADWKLRSWPLTVGGNYNWTPDNHVTLATQAAAGGIDQRVTAGAKRALDAYVLWTLNPALQLRASVANVLAADALSSSTVVDGSCSSSAGAVGCVRTESARTTAQTWQVWSLRLEARL
jgi:iron complex outermembrane receptor protein